MSLDHPFDDPVGGASDSYDVEMMEVIEEDCSQQVRPIRSHLQWVRTHIEREPDLEYLRGEVRRMQIVMDELSIFYDSTERVLKTPLSLGAMSIVCRSLDEVQRIIDIAYAELRMGDDR